MLCASLAGMAFGLFPPTPAHASNYRSYVSATGSDSNSCTFTSPCASIPHAVSETFSGGIGSCLDASD